MKARVNLANQQSKSHSDIKEAEDDTSKQSDRELKFTKLLTQT